MIQKNGGAAFPQSGFEQWAPEGGMTLRDYLAAKAITVLEPPDDYVGQRETADSYRKWAQKAYRMADAVLAARST
ncbi:hypothetical protein SAMN03159444_00126 [Pseudomonas sp. NFACC02]|uniref:hypothetical protein n=1 Tax=Pseudomonas sp. NFACC02 TaxID=1566250 RepID=UPI0008D3D844|nr:hypothetical protein [Pseudomonas sp. NFACC02]SEP58344.1 hypothetical protein SAMN03159444_00126 [Pseudomonas sp. NFACC02]